MQHFSTSASKFGIQGEYLDSEVDFVDNALAGSVLAEKKFEVVGQVMLPVSINVMHGFFGKKFSSKRLLHYIAVFQHFRFLAVVGECRNRDPNVTVAFHVSPYVAGFKAFERLSTLVGGFALDATKFLFAVNVSLRFSATTLFFAALKTCKAVFEHRIFSTSNARTVDRTVQGVFSEFHPVSFYDRGLVRKEVAAFFTVKFERLYLRSFPSVDAFVSSHARLTAEPLAGIFRFNTERAAAIFARFIEWRRGSPCVEYAGGTLS